VWGGVGQRWGGSKTLPRFLGGGSYPRGSFCGGTTPEWEKPPPKSSLHPGNTDQKCGTCNGSPKNLRKKGRGGTGGVQDGFRDALVLAGKSLNTTNGKGGNVQGDYGKRDNIFVSKNH